MSVSNGLTLISNPEQSERLHVRVKHYLYIPAEKIHNIKAKGFTTKKVCECVAGFIKSDQGFALFHFYKKNDPNDLLRLINRDFKKATSVKIILIGGNPNGICLPWKAHHRDLKFKNLDGTELFDVKAMEQLEKMKENFIDLTCYEKDLYLMSSIYEQRRMKILKDDYPFFSYDWSKINDRIGKKKFVVKGSTSFGECSFTLNGIKDFVFYQNVKSVAQICIIYTKNVTHFNCISGDNILCADFNGEVGIYRGNRVQLPRANSTGFEGEKIQDLPSFKSPKSRIKCQFIMAQKQLQVKNTILSMSSNSQKLIL